MNNQPEPKDFFDGPDEPTLVSYVAEVLERPQSTPLITKAKFKQQPTSFEVEAFAWWAEVKQHCDTLGLDWHHYIVDGRRYKTLYKDRPELLEALRSEVELRGKPN